jgi:hypothetical protein
MGSPLLEEESYARFLALSPYVAHPLRLHGSSVWTALSTDNDPVNAPQIKAKRPQKWFARQEAHLGWYFPQIVNPARPRLILDRNAHPHVVGPGQAWRHLCQPV